MTAAQRDASGFFESYAEGFDSLYGTKRSWLNEIVNPVLRKSMRLRTERTLETCQPVEGKRILDIGCGPGHQMVALAKLGAAEVTGVDFAPAMLEIAQGHAESAGVADRCTLVLGDFMTESLPGPYDHAVVLGVMDYVEEPAPFLARVLEHVSRSACLSFPAAGGFLAWQRQVRYRWKCPLYLYERERLEALLEDVAPGRWSLENIARDFFVRLDAASGDGH